MAFLKMASMETRLFTGSDYLNPLNEPYLIDVITELLNL